jgi:hypothetical protein
LHAYGGLTLTRKAYEPQRAIASASFTAVGVRVFLPAVERHADSISLSVIAQKAMAGTLRIDASSKQLAQASSWRSGKKRFQYCRLIQGS